ncbi:hypothetical protein ACFL6U_28070 [Planctomycetota bacterium]
MKMFRIGLVINLFLMTATFAGEFRLGSLFQNHMVLQRDMPVPIWGTADAGDRIRVEFVDQPKTTQADAKGRWQVRLDPMSASLTSRVLKVSAIVKSMVETRECFDVLVGEVWICSGQSSMQYGVGSVPEIKELVPNQKNLRTFSVKRTVAFTEQNTLEGQWQAQGPESAVAFSLGN